MLRAPTADGVVVTVHDLGGSGRPLLLVHGNGFCALTWRPFAAALAADHRCWAPDLRGHGATGAPAGHDFGWDGFATDVLAVVDRLGWAPGSAVAVGHSMGGAALLRAEQRRPGTFAALWLWEPIVFPAPELAADAESGLVAAALRRRRDFGSRDEAAAAFSSKPPLDALHPDAMAGYVEGGLVDRPGGVTLACAPEDEAQIFRMGSAHDTWAHLGQLTLPVAVACGGAPGAVGRALAEAQVAQLPDGRLEVFDDLDHFGPMAEPEATAAAARAWLAPR